MGESKRGRLTAGLILIVIGLGFFLIERYEGIGEEAVLLIIGAAFLVGYFVRQNYGLLIPGCILLGLGIGGLGSDSFLAFGDSERLGLGFGFVAIFVISWLKERSRHWWPLIPGGILLIMAIPRTQGFFEYLWQHWQLILVIIGVLIVIGALRAKEE